MKKVSIIGAFMLFIAAGIWGVAFVAQSVGMDYLGPFSFNAIRYFMGSFVLIPFFLIRDGIQKKSNQSIKKDKKWKKNTYLGGAVCGVALFVSSILQQFGIMYTSVSKAGFITSLYIIIVPILGLFLHKKVRIHVWICALVAIFGLYLLTMGNGFHIEIGDLLVLVCAICFSVHILLIDHFAPEGDAVRISCVQFGVCATLCTIFALIFEKITISAVFAAWLPLLYTGLLSCGVAYTFQVVAQKYVEPTKASLILCMESVIATIAGWLILGQTLSARETIGCIVVFLAVIASQLPWKMNKEEKSKN